MLGALIALAVGTSELLKRFAGIDFEEQFPAISWVFAAAVVIAFLVHIFAFAEEAKTSPFQVAAAVYVIVAYFIIPGFTPRLSYPGLTRADQVKSCLQAHHAELEKRCNKEISPGEPWRLKN